MFGGRGYYIVFALCLWPPGSIGYFALFDRGTEVQTGTRPGVDMQPVTPTTPVVKPAPVVLPTEIDTAADAEVEITEPAVLLPQVVSPLRTARQ